MGVIAQYQVSGSFPSTVGGLGNGLKYFPNLPGAGIGLQPATPSASSAVGQLPFPGANRLSGNRFRVYASGNAFNGAAGVGTLTPIIQINKGTLATPNYVTLFAPGASQAFTAGVAEVWSMAVDAVVDSVSGKLVGFGKVSFSQGTSIVEAILTPVTGLTDSNNSTTGLAPFGLVVGVTFSAAAADSLAQLAEFIVQD